MSSNLFESFNRGTLKLPEKSVEFADIPWCRHPEFEGVELKHIVTGANTEGRFSCHLVRIAPHKRIGNHIHQTQVEIHEVIDGAGVCINGGTELIYKTGIVSVIPSGVPHEVDAGETGLYLFAKFVPALC